MMNFIIIFYLHFFIDCVNMQTYRLFCCCFSSFHIQFFLLLLLQLHTHTLTKPSYINENQSTKIFKFIDLEICWMVGFDGTSIPHTTDLPIFLEFSPILFPNFSQSIFMFFYSNFSNYPPVITNRTNR